MYGMIHRGLREMVIEARGKETWAAIEDAVGTGPEHMISAGSYDDELTTAMIRMAAEQLGKAPSECMRDFGRYWILFAERGPYGAMMDFTGRDLSDFIRNLDRMHQALKEVMPSAEMPSMRLTSELPGYLRVEYHSKRLGLEPFVTGLFEGLLQKFNHVGSVTQVESDECNSVFELKY